MKARLPPLDQYLSALAPSTAASEASLAAPALTLFGGILGRQVAVELGRLQFPIIYSMVTGESRNALKSTGLGCAQDFSHRLQRPPKFFSGSPSAEGLMEYLPEDGGALFFAASEARTFFARMKQKANAALPSLFTDLWDCLPSVGLAVRKNPVTRKEPTMVFCGCSTTEFLEGVIDDTDFDGGVINRLAFFAAPSVKPYPLPKPSDESALAEVARVVELAADVRGRHTYCVSGSAAKAWTDYFHRNQERRDAIATDLLQKVTSRTDVYAARFAAIAAGIMRRRGSRLDVGDVEFGWALADYCAASAEAAIGQMTFGRIVRLEHKIIDKLQTSGPLKKRILQQRIRGGHSAYTASDFNNTLNQLMILGEVDEDESGLLYAVGPVGEES
jgi:hypothetical protein